MQQASISPTDRRGVTDDADYEHFLARIGKRFNDNLKNGERPLFKTGAEGLWDAYLQSFDDPAMRQHHNCSACRHFINRFGGLVTIDDTGRTASALWDEEGAPEEYKRGIAAMARLAVRAKVTGPFLSSEPVLGSPRTDTWQHLSAMLPMALLYKPGILTAGQKMAEKREDFGTVCRALAEFPAAAVDQAITLLSTDSLYRSEKVLGQAEFLQRLHAARAAAHGDLKANLTWLAITTAPAGLCHPRSSMIGTLLEDIAAGMDFDEVSRRFAEKMHPLRYQRPQAAPRAGAIEAAEKMVAQLGLERAFARRFATIDEVQALWKPVVAEEKSKPAGGLFSGLKPRGEADTNAATSSMPPVVMTWQKFEREVLPTAALIEAHITAGAMSFCSFVTAVDPEAPPLLQWDRDDHRNPVSWYFYHGGSTAASYSLAPGFVEVLAVTLKPSMWGDSAVMHQGKGVMFVLAGARDTKSPGIALFPECIRSELHGIRSVIEAYSRSAKLIDAEGQLAAGLMVNAGQSGENWNLRLRVTAAGRKVEYRLDRWD